MPRALFIYLVSIWMMLVWTDIDTHSAGFRYLISSSLLMGFPLCIWLARRMAPTARGAGVVRTLAASIGAVLLPLSALCLSQLVDGHASRDADGHELVAASLVEALESSQSPDGLRLRIRGLTLAPAYLAMTGPGLARAELLVDTSLVPDMEGQSLMIEARLLGTSDGRLVWRTEYRVDAADIKAIRRVLLRALSEGMSRTCEGESVGEGELI
ncbi:MAG: hypothetical protein WBN65_13595 [Gammaproteobacteria bacterium]